MAGDSEVKGGGRKRHRPGSERILSSAFCLLLSALVLLSCSAGRDTGTRIEFWGLGKEGEVVADLIPEFERRNPDIHVTVQQIPWTAAHEKLLTAFVGESTPDLAQMGNTWVPEFEAIGALENLSPWVARSPSIDPSDYFPGIWATNVVDRALYGVPWYVDTRVLFCRTDIFAAAGYTHPPRTWGEWVDLMQKIRARQGPNQYPILLPTNEWPQPVTLALELGSPILRDGGRYGGFQDPRFARAFHFYLSLFRRGYAPVLSNSQVANRYQQFGTGDFAMLISGPWDVGELKTRLPKDVRWMTAAMPAPDGTPSPGISLAGGSSLVLFRASPKKDAAWKLVEFLSEPQQQARFFELTKDLPARRSAWRTPALVGDPYIDAFRQQLEHVVPTPVVPEWEQIATMIFETAEAAIRGGLSEDRALKVMDARADQILAKRRWVLARKEAAK